MELVWSLHASIFYVGVRQWVKGMPFPNCLEAHVDRQADAILNGTPAVLINLTKATKAVDTAKSEKRRSPVSRQAPVFHRISVSGLFDEGMRWRGNTGQVVPSNYHLTIDR